MRCDDDRIEIIVHGLSADWGSWEIVQATLVGFTHARRKHNPDLVALISGQDYPVRDLAEWEKMAIAASGWIGEARPLNYRAHWGKRYGDGDDRLTRYTYRWFRSPAEVLGLRLPDPIDRVWRRARRAVALRLEPMLSVRVVTRGRGTYYGVRRARSPFTSGRPCWFGAQWLAVRRHELDRLLDVDLAPGSRLWRLYRRSIIPDESALVTPLCWAGPPAAMPPVTHLRWDDASDQVRIWERGDIREIVASGAPFCRKVDPVRSSDLLDMLDRRSALGGAA